MLNKFLMWFFLYFSLQNENRALRLKETPTVAVAAQYVEELIPSTPFGVAILANPESSSSRVTWDYFDETGYVQRGRLRQGEDPYLRNRFNQQASDALSSNRIIPDTRNAKWVSNLIVLVHDIPDAIYWNGVFSILNKLYVKLCGESSHCNLIKIHTHDKIIDFQHETLLTWNYAL